MDFVNSSPILSETMNNVDTSSVCVIYKKDDIPFIDCLKKSKQGEITNHTKHLNSKHKEHVDELEKQNTLKRLS